VSRDLTKTDVHLWLAKHYVPSAKELSVLSEAEQQRAEACSNPEVRARLLATFALRRQVLSQYLACAPEELAFRSGPWGKPELKESNSDLHFNGSHSRQYLLLAVGRHPLGVDIQQHKTTNTGYLRLAERFFAKAEVEILAAQDPKQRQQLFYRLWTRKEAFVKALGKGISFGLRRFSVSAEEAGMHCLLSVDDSATLARPWTLGSIPLVEQDYSAALAVKAEVKLSLHFWQSA